MRERLYEYPVITVAVPLYNERAERLQRGDLLALDGGSLFLVLEPLPLFKNRHALVKGVLDVRPAFVEVVLSIYRGQPSITVLAYEDHHP